MDKVIPKPREGLRWTKERRKAKREAKRRYTEATKKMMDDLITQRELKTMTIDSYFNWRQKIEPHIVKKTQEDQGNCLWCEKFAGLGFAICMNCGAPFLAGDGQEDGLKS